MMAEQKWFIYRAVEGIVRGSTVISVRGGDGESH